MASLWRTQRPRFPHYISDGNGRDYYIKYNNAGYWEGQFKIYKKPDYEYPKYSNYHTLFHQAAPFKYYATGNGRETYIINAGGLYHEQRPLASYKLDDFLRGSKTIADTPIFPNKKRYLSLGEKKYNNQLKSLERNLIKRLYHIPKKNKKEEENDVLRNLENNKDIEHGDKTKSNMILNMYESANNTLNSTKNKDKKNLTLSLNDNLETIFKQTQQINKYEMKNNARRSNNESDYNTYKDGKIGCRIKILKSMYNLPINNKKNYAMKRFNTEENKNFPERIQKWKIKNNKFSDLKSIEKENN